MIDFLLDEVTHDIDINCFDLKFTEQETTAISQRLKIKYQFYFSEWFLDSIAGVKWYEEVMKADYNIVTVENELKAVLQEDEDINEIIEFSADFDNALRVLNVSFRVNTVYGNSIEETISLGV